MSSINFQSFSEPKFDSTGNFGFVRGFHRQIGSAAQAPVKACAASSYIDRACTGCTSEQTKNKNISREGTKSSNEIIFLFPLCRFLYLACSLVQLVRLNGINYLRCTSLHKRLCRLLKIKFETRLDSVQLSVLLGMFINFTGINHDHTR